MIRQMPEPCLKIRFSATESAVRPVLRQALHCLADRLSEEDAGNLELALAEVLNNIVEHAYAGRSPGCVHLVVTRESAAVFCRVEDDGHPMPGLRLPEGAIAPVADRIEDMAEGGWGWAMIRALTFDLDYQRYTDHNSLSFRVPVANRSAGMVGSA